MIFADSSVWIDYLAGVINPSTDYLAELHGARGLAMGDLIAMEILRGVRDEQRYKRIRAQVLGTVPIEMAPTPIVLKSAENYRALRARGITIRSAIDCIIATFCIEGGHELLHSDRDFDPFEQHFGLRVVRAS